jgi:D-aminopeptidase
LVANELFVFVDAAGGDDMMLAQGSKEVNWIEGSTMPNDCTRRSTIDQPQTSGAAYMLHESRVYVESRQEQSASLSQKEPIGTL